MNEIERAIEQIEKEKQCVIRADKCNRDCDNCDLLSDTENILNSYDLAIQALQNCIPNKRRSRTSIERRCSR